MRKYQVNLTETTGATSAIDIITAADGYTAEQYVKDCNANADDDWCNMVNSGIITLEEV